MSSIPEVGPELSSKSVKSKNDSHSQSEPNEEDIRRKLWKYIGYKGYASFVSSDNDLFILRRFSSLNARVALLLQDQLSVLEEDLEKLDRKYSDKNFDDLHNDKFRGDREDRTGKLEEIAEKLQQYNNFVVSLSHLRSLPEAPKRNIKFVRNWHYNHDYRVISPYETRYLFGHDHSKDLISISSRKDKTCLRNMIDSSVRLPTLHALGNLKLKLAVITVFIYFLLLVVSLMMVTKPGVALAITAAYAAVLMVLVQFGASGS